MEINIPKIYKPEFNDVIDHIEEMIFEKIKLKTVATGGFDVYCLNIEKINCKIIGIEYEELNYNYCVDFLLMLPNSMKNKNE